MNNRDNTAAVRAHPAGGYTLAVPLNGPTTARVYVGQFPNLAAAARFLVTTPAAELQAIAQRMALREPSVQIPTPELVLC